MFSPFLFTRLSPLLKANVKICIQAEPRNFKESSVTEQLLQFYNETFVLLVKLLGYN